MVKKRLTMQEIYMSLAQLLSLRSTCKRARFGCVITDKSLERIWSVGYNGVPKNFPHDVCTGEEGWCGCSHAEMNGLVKVAGRDEEKVIFSTGAPCPTCANLMINSGVSKLYYIEGTYRSDEGLELIKSADISIDAVNPSKLPLGVASKMALDGIASAKQFYETMRTHEPQDEPGEPKEEQVTRIRQPGRISLVGVKVCERVAVINGECFCGFHNLERRELNTEEVLLIKHLRAQLGETG